MKLSRPLEPGQGLRTEVAGLCEGGVPHACLVLSRPPTLAEPRSPTAALSAWAGYPLPEPQVAHLKNGHESHDFPRAVGIASYMNRTVRILSDGNWLLVDPSKRVTRLALRKTKNLRWNKGYSDLQSRDSLPGQGAGVAPTEHSWEMFVSVPNTGCSHQNLHPGDAPNTAESSKPLNHALKNKQTKTTPAILCYWLLL